MGSKWLIWAYLCTPSSGITRKRIRSQKELVPLLLVNTYDFDALLCLKISLGSSIVKHKWWLRHSLRRQQSGSWQSIRPSEVEVNKINAQCYKRSQKNVIWRSRMVIETFKAKIHVKFFMFFSDIAVPIPKRACSAESRHKLKKTRSFFRIWGK